MVKNRQPQSGILFSRMVVLGLAGTIALCSANTLPVHAESLFRGGIAYQTTQAYTPRSLFAIPRPSNVGDMITVNIDENTTINVQNTTKVQKERDLTENSTGILNNIVRKVTGVKDLLPSVDGLENKDGLTITATSQKLYNYQDTVTCQIVQVLPNGYFLVQGKKAILSNGEQQDLYVSGIVNPYFLNSRNAIASSQLGNLQMNVVGRGIISRQQTDGVIGKYFQFVN